MRHLNEFYNTDRNTNKNSYDDENPEVMKELDNYCQANFNRTFINCGWEEQQEARERARLNKGLDQEEKKRTQDIAKKM